MFESVPPRQDNAQRLLLPTPALTEFYGKRSGLTIAGTPVDEVFGILAQWMAPEDHSALVQEQKELFEKAREGQELYATIPIKLNNKHPIPRLRGRQFLPITIAYSKPDVMADRQVDYSLVIYVDLVEVYKAGQH